MSCLAYAASFVILSLCASFASAQQACSGTPAGTWAAWSPWNANCSDCASLSRYRNRVCFPPQDGGCIATNFNCEGESLEALPCGDTTTTTLLTTTLSTTTKPTTTTTASTSTSTSSPTTTTSSTTTTTPKPSTTTTTTTATTTTTTPRPSTTTTTATTTLTSTTTTTEKVTTTASTSTSTPTSTTSTTASSTPSSTTTTAEPTTSTTRDPSSTTTASVTTTSVGDKCALRPSLIAIDGSNNSTILTDSVNTAFNTWTRNSKANFNTYKKRIETIIYGTAYPDVEDKVALIADVLDGYAPEGSTYRDEVMSVAIVGWGTVEEFVACE